MPPVPKGGRGSNKVEARRNDQPDELGNVLGFHFFHNSCPVDFDGSGTDAEFVGDHLVGPTRDQPVQHLTLAGVRRKLETEQGAPAEEDSSDLDALLGSDVRERLLVVKRGLRELQVDVDGDGWADMAILAQFDYTFVASDFVL